MLWEHPFVARLMMIGNEIQVLHDALRNQPSPSPTDPLYRSVETSETKTISEWQDGYVLTPMGGNKIRAVRKNQGGEIPLTLMPIPSMSN